VQDKINRLKEIQEKKKDVIGWFKEDFSSESLCSL
jgi:hypothetical protein